MKIYTKVRIDMLTGETIEEEFYEYDGPLALCYDDQDNNGDTADFGEDPDDGNDNPDPDTGGNGSETDPYDPASHQLGIDVETQKAIKDQIDNKVAEAVKNNDEINITDYVTGLLSGLPGIAKEAYNDITAYAEAKATATKEVKDSLLASGMTEEKYNEIMNARDPSNLSEEDAGGLRDSGYELRDGHIVPLTSSDGGSDDSSSEETFADVVNMFSVDNINYSPGTIKMESGASALQGTVGALLNAFYNNPDADPSELLGEFFTDINNAKSMITEGGEQYRERLEGISEKWDLGSEQLWNLADNYRVNHDNRMADIQSMKGPYLSIGGKQVVDPDTAQNVRLTPSRHQRNAAALAGQELSGGLAGVQSQRDSAEQWKTGALDTADRWYGSKTNDGKDKAALSGSKLDKLMKDIPGIYGDILGSQTQVAVANANQAGQTARASLDANTRMKIAQLQALAGENEANILAQSKLDVADATKEDEPSFWEKVLGAL